MSKFDKENPYRKKTMSEAQNAKIPSLLFLRFVHWNSCDCIFNSKTNMLHVSFLDYMDGKNREEIKGEKVIDNVMKNRKKDQVKIR